MPKTPDYFAGKTIIITGAASGIGRATALIFAREGANVVCTDLNETGAKETAAQVKQALALKTDVTRRKEVEEMAKARDRCLRYRAVPVQLGRRRHPPREISGDRRRAVRQDLRSEPEGHVLCDAGADPARGQEQARRHRQYGEHGGTPRWTGLLGALCGGERRGGVHDHGRSARIRHARHPRAVDLAWAGEDAVSGRGGDERRAQQEIPGRRASASPRRSAN